MLIYIVTFMISFMLCSIGERLDKKKIRKKANKYYVFAVLVVSILAGLRDFTIGTDISVYGHWMFVGARNANDLYSFMNLNSVVDIGYTIFVYLVALFFENEHWLYFFTGVVIYGFTLFGLRKYEEYCSVSWAWLTYLFLMYGSTLNLMRQCMAIAVAIWSIEYYMKKEYKKFIIFSIVAMLFHSTALALFMIVAVYWLISKQNNLFMKSLIVIATELVIVFYSYILELLMSIGLLSERYGKYVTDISLVGSLFHIVIRLPFLLIIFVFYRQFKRGRKQNCDSTSLYCLQADKIGEFVIVMMIIEMMTAQMSSVSSTLYRISLYFITFRCIAMGRVVENLNKNNRKIVKTILFLMLLVIWIYQTVVMGDNEVYPYTSELIGIG